MIRTDLHVHPSPWRHGQGAFRQFAQAAITGGVDILGFSEHGPPCDPDLRYRGLEISQIEEYVIEVKKVKDEFKGFIQIFCGLELDYQPQYLESYRKLKEEFPFDYFLGSVHSINDWHLDSPDTLSKSVHRDKSHEDLYRLYYQQISEAAQCGLFDGLAHLDYIRRSLPHPPGEPPDFSRDVFEEIAQEIASNGLAVEVNTRGLLIPEMREVYPTRPLMKCLARAGVRFTIGSDAHDEYRIGEGYRSAKMLLMEEGQRDVLYFRRGEVFEVEIV